MAEAPNSMFDTARATVAEVLQRDRRPNRLLTAIRLVGEDLSDQIKANQHGKPIAACARGCSHCCHFVVQAGVGEVLLAADYIQRNFSPDRQKEVSGRLYDYERAVAPSFGLNLNKLRVPCPLLVDDECSIYPARPFRCQGANSLDASECEREKFHPELDIAPPKVHGQLQLAMQATRGVMEGLESVRLDAGRLDFARALRIALTQPDAVDRHFARLNPFSPAVGRREETVSPNPGTEPQYPQYSPGEEPVGACDPSDLFSHFEKAERGDAAGAVALLTGKHPVNLLRRILVPPTYRDEEEVLAWREHVRKAIQNLAEAAFDPREAYDALFALRTFEIAYQQFNDREILSNLGQILCHKIIGSAVPDLAAPIERRRVQGKLKLGYISENIRLHNGAYWALGWLRNHAEDIETSVICLRNQPGVRTEDFADVADNFYLCGDDAPSNARAIKELGLDVLIFTDIGMSGRNYRYASMRLAPVQCTAWGHPVTSGLPTIDYYLSSDLMEPPDGQDHYSESLVRLPNSGLCYERRPFPASTMTKSDFGLDDGPLYLSCQNAMKYLPRWDYLYREICDRTGRPIVFLEGSRIDNSIQQERMRRAGINAIWLPFLGNSDFLALIQLADVNLDTPGWNGGNTTVHCLSRGRPMVTLPGEFMRGRHSLAFCGIAGVQGLVASSPENYIALAANPDQLNESMSELNTDALFEDKAPVLALDAFFRSLF